MKPSKVKPSRATLERKIKELEAQLAHVYHFADLGLKQASQQTCMGSAIIVQLTALGGREIIPPTAIRDGLSDETIEALRRDIRRSYDRAVEMKPNNNGGFIEQ